MVSSSSITAVLLENRLFDQSIVGVFPHDSKYLYYLLAFFNSSTCNTLIRTINSTTNNSSNYIKKIPFILPSETHLTTVTNNVESILKETRAGNCYTESLEEQNNGIFQLLYSF